MDWRLPGLYEIRSLELLLNHFPAGLAPSSVPLLPAPFLDSYFMLHFPVAGTNKGVEMNYRSLPLL